MTQSILAYLPFYPLVSFLLLITFGKRLSWQLASTLSVGAMLLTTLSSGYLLVALNTQSEAMITSHLWHWFSLSLSAETSPTTLVNVAFYLDGLSAVMISVVSGVGFLIHLYAAAYMKADENFTRFMAYMNLFIVAMLILVLADNLVLLYLGWEGVGLCSFLLIGFWYQEQKNVLAARKAFIVTRIGDTSMAIALFMLFSATGELNIAHINENAASVWQVSDSQVYWIALLLLGGAVGKSAQLPLQTWLPDAMAGPTPVSALIHAATMVTAGVYLIARMHGVFILSPQVMTYVAWLGALTLLLAGFTALAQSDIKRILAYSTMSQIGYMMLALGAGAWSAGIFHLMTHAFFKALLFLTAGSIIYALHHQQNIFHMGGLARRLPKETLFFTIGLVCLVALPGSSGFFSKEMIIAQLWSSSTAGESLWWCAILGALITSIYSTRLFLITFMGKSRKKQTLATTSSKLMTGTLVTLAALSLLGGYFPPELNTLFAVSAVVGQTAVEPGWLHTVAIATPFIGITFSWFYFGRYRQNQGEQIKENDSFVYRLAKQGFGFDVLYEWLLVKPYCTLAKINQRDMFDQLMMLNAWYVQFWRDALIVSQNGQIRWYAAAFVLGLVCLLGVLLI